jgi:ferrous iron transport protein A
MIRSITQISAENATQTTAESAEGALRALTLDRLAQASLPDAAVIEGVEGPPALRRRLQEAGFTAGCPIRFVMATPFGDPLVFSLRGASIALRATEARCVRVRF